MVPSPASPRLPVFRMALLAVETAAPTVPSIDKWTRGVSAAGEAANCSTPAVMEVVPE